MAHQPSELSCRFLNFLAPLGILHIQQQPLSHLRCVRCSTKHPPSHSNSESRRPSLMLVIRMITLVVRIWKVKVLYNEDIMKHVKSFFASAPFPCAQ
eukprot:4697705-Amphidinium_carterae.1